jgi:hypothetical protein
MILKTSKRTQLNFMIIYITASQMYGDHLYSINVTFSYT